MNAFKVCPKCGYEWKTRKAFINDETLRLIGYQASFSPTGNGLYLFNHLVAHNRCNTTLAVEVDSFMSLYDGPLYAEIQAGSETCSGHCLTVEDLERCQADCKNASARELMLALFKIN